MEKYFRQYKGENEIEEISKREALKRLSGVYGSNTKLALSNSSQKHPVSNPYAFYWKSN